MLLSKVWGGSNLTKVGKKVPPGAKIGESWELADLASTSSSGAGGGAFRSLIANGSLQGKTLADALSAWGSAVALPSKRSPQDGYPLLVKYLDAQENLSIQVHPSAAYANAHPGAYLKSECWYILSATPGAVIYKGLQPGTTRERFAQAVKDGTVVDLLVAIEAIPHQCHNLPSGTCHALGAGVVVLEVQTASDTTFRVYDWGRTGRELHIQESLDCIDFDSAPPAPTIFNPREADGGTLFTEYFTLSQRTTRKDPIDLSGHVGPFMVISGSGNLCWTDSLGETSSHAIPVASGTTGLIPGAKAHHHQSRGDCGQRVWLVPTDDAPLTIMLATLT